MRKSAQSLAQTLETFRKSPLAARARVAVYILTHVRHRTRREWYYDLTRTCARDGPRGDRNQSRMLCLLITLTPTAFSAATRATSLLRQRTVLHPCSYSFCCSGSASSELQSQGKHDLALQGGPAKSGVEDLSAIRAIDASLRNIQIDVVEEVEHVGAELK
jgi:hypothetical protein